jgi:RNA-directed DNA polymerase
MEDGLVSPADEGTPQGGPLSPLLSNLVLDELDRELERRDHHFVRYADDCIVYVDSERAGQRVMESVTHFITHRLKLKVNQATSAVARPWQRKFLGFSFTGEQEPRRRIASKAIARFKQRIRKQTRRTRDISLAQMVKEIATYLRGWLGYFDDCQTPSVLQSLESWLCRRLRSVVWKQWKRGRTRLRELRKRGVSPDLAAQTAGMRTARGASPIRRPCTLRSPMPTSPLLDFYPWSYGFGLTRRTAVCGPACTVVWEAGTGNRLSPMPMHKQMFWPSASC